MGEAGVTTALEIIQNHCPIEKRIWDVVLTIWMIGWVGTPAAFLIHLDWAVPAGLCLLFLPSAYVTCRSRLHRAGVLRCDWIVALR